MYLIKVSNKKVIKVIVGDEVFLSSMIDNEAGKWIISADNAGIGYNYDNGNFYKPQPYPSWKLDSNFEWQSPKVQDNEAWLEDKQKWVTSVEHMKYMTQKPFITAIQAHLDFKANEYGYDDMISACSYAGFTNSFQIESQSFITWRANVWTASFMVLTDVEAGAIPTPTIDELIVMLPIYGI